MNPKQPIQTDCNPKKGSHPGRGGVDLTLTPIPFDSVEALLRVKPPREDSSSADEREQE
jgi:hypothetical protein